MCSLMHFEIIRLPESLPTLHAEVRSFPRMRSLVSLQAVGAEEALVALAARVGPRAGVVAQVDGQVAGLGEPLPAVGALEGLVARVEALVLQELGVGEEALPAVGAEVRPLTRVRELVSYQRRLVHEALVALRAAEDVLPGVAALVLLHVAFPLEALAAVGAHERHVLRVDLHVAQQASLVEEPFPALRARVRPVFLVDALVCGEGRPVGEALAAVAGVLLFLLVGAEVPAEVAGAAEAQVAVRAFIRTRRLVVVVVVLAVGLQMPDQCRLPGEGPSALGAQILAVLHVAALMIPLSRRGFEVLPADHAFVFTSRPVRLLVPLQRLLGGEAPPTLRTQKGLLPAVEEPVGFQQRLELEAFVTVGTTVSSSAVAGKLQTLVSLCFS